MATARGPAPEAGALSRRATLLTAILPPLALAAALLVGGLVRWSELRRQSLWEDEIVSGYLAQSTVPDLLRLTAHNDVHPPLYYLVANIAYHSLHLGMVDALRVPSLVAGVATVAVMFALGWKLAGRWAGAIAAVLTAISPMAVWYSHEGRMYALTWLLVALSYLLLAMACERQRPHWLVAYALVTGLALWSDISAFLGVVPQLAVIATARPRRWPAVAFLAAFALYVPWVPSLLQQWPLLSTATFQIASSWQLWWHVALAQLGLYAGYASLGDLVPAGLAALVLAGYAAVAVAGARAAGPRLVYGLALALGPIGLGLVLAAAGSHAVVVPRVEGVSSLGFGLCAGMLVAAALRSPQVWRYGGALAAAVVIAAGAAAGLAREVSAGSNGQPWNLWVQALDSEVRPDDAIVIVPATLLVVTRAYLPADSLVNIEATSTWVTPIPVLDATLVAQGSRGERLWVLYLDTNGADIAAHDEYLRAHGYHRISGDPRRRMGVLGYSGP